MTAMLGWYHEGGPIMLLILLIGVSGLGILIERAYVIVVRSKTDGRAFIENVIRLVHTGKIDDAIKHCADSTAALSDIGLLILRSRSRDESSLHNIANTASLAVLPKVTRRLPYLPTFAVVAVVLGLLGTTIESRRALVTHGGDSASVAAGIGHALVPTAFGLAVAAMLVLGRGYLLNESESIAAAIREFSARLINALLDRPDVGLGHR